IVVSPTSTARTADEFGATVADPRSGRPTRRSSHHFYRRDPQQLCFRVDPALLSASPRVRTTALSLSGGSGNLVGISARTLGRASACAYSERARRRPPQFDAR